MNNSVSIRDIGSDKGAGMASKNCTNSDPGLDYKKGQINDDDNKANGNTNRDIQDTEFLSCLVCNTSFSRKPDLMKHLSKIHRLTNLCTLCYFQKSEIHRSANPVSLRNHKLRAHPDDMVHCVCGTLFIDERMLMFHLKKFKCDVRLADNACTDTDMIKCVCGKRFVNEELLSDHKMFKCRKRGSNVNTKQCATASYSDVYSPNDEKVSRDVGKPLLVKTESVSNENYTNMNSLIGKKIHFDLNNNNIVKKESVADVDINMNMVKVKQEIKDEKFSTNVIPDNYTNVSLTSLTTPADLYEKVGTSATFGDYKTFMTTSTKPEKFGHHTLEMGNRSSIKMKSDLDDNFFRSAVDKKLGLNSGSGNNFGPSQTAGTSNNSNNIQTTPTKAKKVVAKKGKGQTKGVKDVAGQKKKDAVKKKKKVGKPDAEGRYPCKTCKRRFKRPYLYVHQKQVHAKKQWVIAAAPRSYKCGWCNFTSHYYTSIITHHYKKHPDMEFI